MLSIVSGAILPLVALGFIKSLVDYVKPAEEAQLEVAETVTHAESVVVEETEPQIIKPEPQIDNYISIDAKLARGIQ
jgi:hypothetical protein